jgi:hypothetical protein
MFARWRIVTEDRLRHRPLLRRWMSRWLEWTAPAANTADPQSLARRIQRLCAAARAAPGRNRMIGLDRRLSELARMIGSQRIDWSEFEPGVEKPAIELGVLLKPWIGDREKGVVFISFEHQWVKLAALKNLPALARRYTLVISPTWSPPHSVTNCVFPMLFPDPIVCLMSNRNDLEIFPRLSPNYRMVPLYASNWVNPRFYQSVPAGKKDLDIVMLANFGGYKRHHALFAAMREFSRPLRVVCAGQHNGNRNAAVLLAEAEIFGVRDRFELKENPNDDDVAQLLSRAKTSVILSRREGSCVAVVESLFANTPVGLLEDAEIGSKEFINSQTGRMLQHSALGRQLEQFVAESAQYRPREWAEGRGIDCFGSTRTLNAALRDLANSTGQQWTADIAEHCWRPKPQLVHDADRVRMQPDYDWLEREMDLKFVHR